MFHTNHHLYLQVQPVLFVVGTTAVSVIVMSYCVYCCEREQQPEVFNFGNTVRRRRDPLSALNDPLSALNSYAYEL